MFAAVFWFIQNGITRFWEFFEGITKVDIATFLTNLLGGNLAYCRSNGKKVIANSIKVAQSCKMPFFNWLLQACFIRFSKLLLSNKVNTKHPNLNTFASNLTPIGKIGCNCRVAYGGL